MLKTPQGSQGGVGALVVVIVIVVMALVSGAGYYVYQRNQSTKLASTTDNQSAAASTTKPKPPASPPAVKDTKKYLVIKEWGVKFALDGQTDSAVYSIKADLPNVAYLSLKKVSDIAPRCAADKQSMAAIGRLTEAEQEAFVADPNKAGAPGTVHIGKYWYNFEHSHASCTDNEAQDKAINAIYKESPEYILTQAALKLQAE